MSKIAIIGGGMAGLGAAYELVQRGDTGHAGGSVPEIAIFEKSDRLGGLAATVKVSGEPLEIFYHHMFPSYRDFSEIAEPLGIKDKMFFRRAKSGIYYEGEMFPFDSALDLLKFSPLTFTERLRTGLVIARLKFTRRWQKYEGVRADEWSRRHFGKKAYRVIWEPLLKSKFGAYLDRVGMTWFWARIYERPSRFGYFHGSFQVLADALEKYLRAHGVKVLTGQGVERIDKKDDGTFVVSIPGGAQSSFDHVIVAAQPAPLIKFAGHLLPSEYIASISNLKYLGAICAIMVLKQHLTNYYWLNINDDGFPFVGVIEQSNFVDPKVYGGLHPVYLSRYLDPASDFYQLSDEEIWSQYLAAVKRIRPDFDESWITEKYLFRTPLAQPVITPEYRQTLPAYKTPVRNLWWVSMSHVYPWERSTDHSFHVGRELARELLGE